MKPTANMSVFRDDRLCRIWHGQGRRFTQGKRVSADCPLSPAERRIYVEQGAIAAIRHLMDTRNLPLAEAKRLLDAARSPAFIGRKRIA